MIAGLSIDAADIAALAAGKHTNQMELERTLVQLAREGELKGVVTKAPRYSATTIQWHADCQRKFFWPTIAGLEDPPSEQQKFGTTLHAYQEKYLLTGELPPRHSPEGILASIGLPLLPKPLAPGLYVEQPFEVKFEDVPVIITGTRDFGVDPTDEELDAKGFMLGDHKTKKNKKYPMSKEWLEKNIQANLYAYTKWAELHARGFTQLRVVSKNWIYYYKEEREGFKLRTVQALDEVAEQFETVIKPNVINMAAIAQAAPKLSDIPLPTDRSVCDQYGGCKHRARCFGFGNKSESNMGVLANKYSQSNIAAQAAPARAAATGAGAAINPPPAPKVPPRSLAQVQEAQDMADVPADVAAEVAEQEAAPPVAKKGRRTKAQIAADNAAAAAEQPAEQSEVEEARTPSMSRTTPGANPAHDFWLFVGCRPAKGFDATTVYAEEIVGSAQAQAANRLGTQHYREGTGNYGVLEACFADWLEANPLAGAIIVDPASIVARDIIGLLRAHAAVVIERVQ